MLPSNQQHNTIYRYRQLFSGARCEVSLPSPQRPWEPRSSAAAALPPLGPVPSRGVAVAAAAGRARRGRDGALSPVVLLRAPAGAWKGPRGRRASPGVSAVPPSRCHLRPPVGREDQPRPAGDELRSQPHAALPRRRGRAPRVVPAPLRQLVPAEPSGGSAHAAAAGWAQRFGAGTTHPFCHAPG